MWRNFHLGRATTLRVATAASTVVTREAAVASRRSGSSTSSGGAAPHAVWIMHSSGLVGKEHCTPMLCHIIPSGCT